MRRRDQQKVEQKGSGKMEKRRKIQKLRNLEIRGPSACALRVSGVTRKVTRDEWLVTRGTKTKLSIFGFYVELFCL
jgi:hypothetical protein